MKVKIDHSNEKMVITVEESALGGLAIHQGDDMIYVHTDNIKLFVAAVQAVASDMLGEEV